MQKILKLFSESKIIKKYAFIEYKSGSNFLYYKAKIELINDELLYVKEFITSLEHAYSYHWQKENGE